MSETSRAGFWGSQVGDVPAWNLLHKEKLFFLIRRMFTVPLGNGPPFCHIVRLELRFG
jgi:hypothetical protein